MKSTLAVFVLGFFALIVQGALARTIPPPWCPDLSWLVVVAVGLRWPHFISGLLVAVTLGYSMDLVSGSLMGQHALLRLGTYLAAAVAARQLDFSGAFPVSIFVFGMTVIYGLSIVGILSFFVASEGVGLPVIGDALCHGLANTVAAGPVLALVEMLIARLSDEEVGRRGPVAMGLRRGGVG